MIYLILFFIAFALFLYQKSSYATANLVKGFLVGFSYTEIPTETEGQEGTLAVYQLSFVFILITLYFYTNE